MADRYEEVTYESWFERIKNSFLGVVVGLILCIASFPVLFFNERNAVKTARSLDEIAHNVITINTQSVDPANEGKLVHASGNLTVDTQVTDPLFGIQAQVIALKRDVRFYQWHESTQTSSSESFGGGKTTTKTYDYRKAWSSFPIDSSNFKHPEGHENTVPLGYESKTFISDKAHFGAFYMPAFMINKLDNFESVIIQPKDIDVILDPALKTKVKVHNGGFIMGDPLNPLIGDMQIYFSAIHPGTVSIIAQQQGQSFTSYAAKAGKTIELIQAGSHGVPEMIKEAKKMNTLITWLLRLAGFILMWLGLALIAGPLSTLFAIIPFVGSLVGAGIGLISLILALLLSSGVIALSWLWYRPVVAIAIMGGAALIVWVAIRFWGRSRA